MITKLLDRWAAKRMHNQQQRQYAAAKHGRLHYGWMPASTTVNDEIRSSSQAVRNRVRQLVRDFGPVARAVDVLESLVVGPQGYKWQSQHDQRARLEEAMERWSEHADAAGRLHFCELQQLAERQICECGEYLFLIRRDKKAWAPFQLLAIEPDRLAHDYLGQHIDQGVEYNPVTGQVLAYHLDQGEYSRKVTRVPASEVLHGFHVLRPGQLRGISPFTSGVLLSNDLSEFVNAEIDGAKTAAKYVAFVETPDLAGFQELRGIGQDPVSDERIDDLENAAIEYLRPGEQIKIASHNRPGNGFDPFVRFILRMLSVTTGVPYDLLSGDYSQSNYSSSRLARNDFGAWLKFRQAQRVRHFCQPSLMGAMEAMVLAGRVSLPGYFNDPWAWLDGRWTTPGLPPVDPLKEAKAQRDQIDGTLWSEFEIAAERGRDYEDILDEMALAKAMREERGLEVKEVSTSMSTNPAALEPDEEEVEEE